MNLVAKNSPAVKTAPAGAPPAISVMPTTTRPSPHVINLKSAVAEAHPEEKNPYRGPFAWFHRLLDERIHLRDHRTRTLSIRARGWRDFPPIEAVTLRQAVIITAKRFVNEHPLADLTVVSVIHLTVLVIWKAVVLPIERLSKTAKPNAATSSRRVLPLMAVGPDQKTTSPKTRPAARPSQPRLSFERPRGWLTSIASFAAMATLAVLPAGAYGTLKNGALPVSGIIASASAGAQNLVSAAQAAEQFDFTAAGPDFRQAAASFTDANDGLGPLGRTVSYLAALLPAKSRLAAAAPLLEAGQESSTGGLIMSEALRRIIGNSDVTNIDKLRLLDVAVLNALPHFERANLALAAVPLFSVPAEYRDRVAAAQAELPNALDFLRRAAPALDLLTAAAGSDGPRRYLLVFQNNAELRPTGGFIGSFAVLDVKNGQIDKLNVPAGGAYDLQGQLNLKLASPQPLHLVNPDWQFQDANWYPDFPTSAENLMRFYEHSGGTTVDGIIAVNETVMERLLDVLGPIDMPEYGKTITAQNFFYETQKEVEVDFDKTANRPKQFLADLAPKLLARLQTMDADTVVRLGQQLMDALQAKELTFWMRHAEEQQQVANLGWDGGVRQTPGDYLMVVHTNIAGQKTDLVMHDAIQHEVKILPDGEAIVTLTLTRTHAGEKGALFTGVRNVDFVRFYVPLGSELVSAQGFTAPDPKLFKISEDGYGSDPTVAAEEAATKYDRDSGTRVGVESGHTVFGNWLQTDPGETTVATLVYRLPANTVRLVRADASGWSDRLALAAGRTSPTRLDYRLLVQKQSGANPAQLTVTTDLPAGWYAAASTPTMTHDAEGDETATGLLDRDLTFSLTAASSADR